MYINKSKHLHPTPVFCPANPGVSASVKQATDAKTIHCRMKTNYIYVYIYI